MIIIINTCITAITYHVCQVDGADREILGVGLPVPFTMEAYNAQRISTFRLSTSVTLNGPVVDSSELDSEDRVNQFIWNQFLSHSLPQESIHATTLYGTMDLPKS